MQGETPIACPRSSSASNPGIVFAAIDPRTGPPAAEEVAEATRTAWMQGAASIAPKQSGGGDHLVGSGGVSWRAWPGAGRRPRGWRGGRGLSWRRPRGLKTRRSLSGWERMRTRWASGAGALPRAGSTGFTTSPVPGLRARSAMRRSRRSSPAPWKRRRPTARSGACARWPAPRAMRLRPFTGTAYAHGSGREGRLPHVEIEAWVLND